ncbi:MAG: hypothetical protein ACPL5F_13895 [Moorellaceae bacterium]
MEKRKKHFVAPEQKQVMVDQVKKQVERRREVLFAILHGSFLLESKNFQYNFGLEFRRTPCPGEQTGSCRAAA